MNLKPDLFIFTGSFPSVTNAELWLEEELNITHNEFRKIVIFPELDEYEPLTLPFNCYPQYQSVSNAGKENLNLLNYIFIVQVILSDFGALSRQRVFFKNLAYNFSLIKKLVKRAKYISQLIEQKNNTIIYSYWADNQATLGCIIKHYFSKEIKVVSRAHGYEIYEDLKKDKVIPFRVFHNKYIDRIFSVSKRGYHHLASKYPASVAKYDVSYLGTTDHGSGKFDPAADFTVATCCHLNSIKRLHLMAEILKNISFQLTWHILGDGPELEAIKKANSILGKNISVVYHGSMTKAEINQFYSTQQVNLLVSLSYSEGLPVSMMEAQSFGIPILATDVGGCNEICTPRSGILIERDFESINAAQAITKFRDSEMNTALFHSGCRENWKTNFSAAVNYREFSRQLLQVFSPPIEARSTL